MFYKILSKHYDPIIKIAIKMKKKNTTKMSKRWTAIKTVSKHDEL